MYKNIIEIQLTNSMTIEEPLDHKRIKHITRIIASLNRLSVKFSKTYYIELLKKEIENKFFFHSELINELISLFPISDIFSFLVNSTTSRPLSIRNNTLRWKIAETKKYLKKQGVRCTRVKPIEDIGLIINSTPIRISRSSGFLSGLFTIQGISSMMVVNILFPEKNDRILDLTSSPGGKTTHISQIMQNSGVLIANEKNPKRIGPLVSNIHRLAVNNVIICNYDGRFFKYIMGGFDKVLVDAPCSGTGLMGNDQEIKKKSLKRQIIFNCEIQKKLLIAAIDCCNSSKNGSSFIVYSTCSILVEENEYIVQYALDHRNVKIVPTGINIGLPGFTRYRTKRFDSNMRYCRRFYPHIHNLDGFFICKLLKI